MPRCTHCKLDKPPEEFSKKQVWCKLCVSVYNKSYREANKDHIRSLLSQWREANPNYHKEYRQVNQEHIRATQQIWYEENREYITAQDKEYREANQERIRERKRTWSQSNRELLRTRKRTWNANNKDRVAYQNAKFNYGVSFEEWELLMQQPCAICGSTERLGIDHCHATGKVRGRLCDNCNNGLGRFKDDPTLLLAAISYLQS